MRNLLVYLRFLSKHKTLSVINILGLAIGFAACIFIGLYVNEELSYDQYHKNIDRRALASMCLSQRALVSWAWACSPLF